MTDELSDEDVAYLLSLLDLAREGRTAQLLEALAAGVPANLTGSSGDTLLILAAYYDHPDTVQALLAAGADPERVNDRGQTALGAAVFRRSKPSVESLLAAGADPTTGGRSALEVATFFALDEMLQLLTEARDARASRPDDALPPH